VLLSEACHEAKTVERDDAGAVRSVEVVRAALSPEEREAEVAAHLERSYFSRFKVAQTTRGPFGEVVDWVDPHELDPLFDERKPPSDDADAPSEIPREAMPEPAPERRVAEDKDLYALWSDPAVRGPEGTVPMMRPNFSAYVDGSSGAETLDQFLKMIEKSAPQPAGQQRLYALKWHNTTNIGTQGWIAFTNPSSVSASGGTFSLSQLGVMCPGPNEATTRETIEYGVQEFPTKYGDSNLHLFTFFTETGYQSSGDYLGGYNTDVAGFVPTGTFPPGAVVPDPPGAYGERRFRAVLSGGAWWIQDWVSASSNQWLGYYPIGPSAIDFDYIVNGACRIAWYGEVFDPTETDWTAANLGNGTFGRNNGSLHFRELIIERSSGGNLWFNGTNNGPTDTNCYDQSNLFTSSTSGWQVWFRYGGPGGDNTGCN
jgi:hypothetical protein